MGTFSKSLAGIGGVISWEEPGIEYFKKHTPENFFLGGGGPPPHPPLLV